jgi:ATP-binding cassette subfamily B protein
MLKLFKNLTKKEWLLAGISLIFIVGQVWMDLTMPDYMSEITLLVQTSGSTMSEILIAGGKMLAFALGSLICSIITAICAAKIASGFSATLREKMFKKVQSFSMEEIGHFSTASLITRTTNDVTQVQMLIVMGLQMLIKAPIMAVWAIVKIAGKEFEWTMATAIAVIILLCIVSFAIFITMPKFRQMQKLTDDLNRVTRENLSGLKVVRAYNAEGYQEEKFEQANQNLTNTALFTNRAMAFLMPSIQLVMNALMLSIYWIGAILINQSKLSMRISLFSDMMVFSQYAIQVVMAFMMLVMIFMILPRASVSANRILEVLETKPALENGVHKQGEEGHEGEIEFKNVSFHYPDTGEKVLEDISFTAKKGQTVALIGATGCGKSTLINLIPRFYDASAGEVMVNGINVKDYDQIALRNDIGYISQQAILFSGDIESNIVYGDNGKPAPDQKQIDEAMDVAMASEFVQAKSKGIHSHVAQSGTNYSGGQKQRLSIARAIARDPKILIFDDSFSALDYKTDKALRKALDEHCQDTTRIIVAQRIGTIRDADLILVMDEGKIVGQGKHEELLQTCDVYKQIALSQLSKEELEK